jgi:DNA-binding NtrC family response regulator
MQCATVLIVEADRELQQRLVAGARDHGYTALVAASVANAVAAMESAVIHVALVDLLLGEESGLEAVRQIKERYPEAEVVAMSASTSVESAIQSYELNVFAYVQKPFDIDHLFAVVNRAPADRCASSTSIPASSRKSPSSGRPIRKRSGRRPACT